MTDDPPAHSRSSGLGWPLVVLGVALLAAITVITVTGHDPEMLSRSLGTLLGVIGAGSGVGAWVNSARAAKQTNGDLEKRMDQAVQRGLGKALHEAKANRAAVPAPRGKARVPTVDPRPVKPRD